ncbi:MAG: response regulator transcription factor [Syntrophomonadaceae bacterium]|jgi:DNA-binding response OmpR family regulator|nr:response regulator transcription factor [Syntrophomonadaceae bacterium]
MNILVCDDEPEIVDAIEIYLQNEGYQVFKAYDGLQALRILDAQDIKLIIMDIMMPRMDGIKATLKIREKNNIPVIILSAKSEDTDKIIGLNMGADDYVAKPFNALELIARVKSQLRRYTSLGSLKTEDNVYSSGGLMINDETKTVLVDGEEARLTSVQYKILLLLLKNAGRVFSIEEIYERVWKEEAYNADNVVAVHIRRIREKIEINPKEPKYLKVVWGIGYKVENITKT